MQQGLLIDDLYHPQELDASWWKGSFNTSESSLQQLSPYVGKMKSGMARALLSLYSRPGEIVLDPFSGSGVVALEALLASRCAWASDLSPYAYVLTRAKMEAPEDQEMALDQAETLLREVAEGSAHLDLSSVPQWVQSFYHPNTLREVLTAFDCLKARKDYFLTGCLLGILHHVRPGFLSYPASHLVPYLRQAMYPPEEFPEMYAYRDLGSRLISKIKRAYRRPMIPKEWKDRCYSVWCENAMSLPIRDASVDSIISSPPYFGALDYARDNRLRLWFLGCADWKKLDECLTASNKIYLQQMGQCLVEMSRVLKPKGYCVLVLGDIEKNGQNRRTAEILSSLAVQATENAFTTERIYDDTIPDERRSRRHTSTTKFERILILRRR